MEKLKNQRLSAQGKSLKKYAGARSAQVDAIKTISNVRGFQIAVIHGPEDGDLAHSHLAIISAPGSFSASKPNPNDIRELVSKLFSTFGVLDSHDCSLAPAA